MNWTSPGLVDSDDEEDIPDCPNHLLTRAQLKRRQVRIERERCAPEPAADDCLERRRLDFGKCVVCQLSSDHVAYDPVGHVAGATSSRVAGGKGCVSFGQTDGDFSGLDKMAELVYAVADDRTMGEMAVLGAVAGKCGINDEGELEKLVDGEATEKLNAPPRIRHLMNAMNLGHVLSPINLFEFGSCEVMMNETKWEDVEIEVALDSGSVVHVASESDTPCYTLDSSPGARQCNEFIVGDGGTMKNYGQNTLNLASGQSQFSSVFQIAAVHRPLMSAGRIRDNDNEVLFNKERAVVRGTDGAELCVFTRQPGGLYTAKLKFTSPFPRPER